MKVKLIILSLVLLVCFIAGFSVQVNAADSGGKGRGQGQYYYDITTNWQGKTVPLGESVTAWAATTDPTVTAVFFRWKRPDESIFAEFNYTPLMGPYITPNVPSDVPKQIKDWADKNQGIPIWLASNTQQPDVLGNWTVKAYFIGPGGKTKEHVENAIQVRAASFNVIPDFPVVGTAGALVAMLLGLNLFLHRNKQ